VTAPQVAIYGLKGDWEVENHGIAPDVDVKMDPALVRQGARPALEEAEEVIMEQLQKSPPPVYSKPAYPDYHQKVGK